MELVFQLPQMRISVLISIVDGQKEWSRVGGGIGDTEPQSW